MGPRVAAQLWKASSWTETEQEIGAQSRPRRFEESQYQGQPRSSTYERASSYLSSKQSQRVRQLQGLLVGLLAPGIQIIIPETVVGVSPGTLQLNLTGADQATSCYNVLVTPSTGDVRSASVRVGDAPFVLTTFENLPCGVTSAAVRGCTKCVTDPLAPGSHCTDASEDQVDLPCAPPPA
eukprot:6210377-Pleurochrysis_carterae.AAC.1